MEEALNNQADEMVWPAEIGSLHHQPPALAQRVYECKGPGGRDENLVWA